MSILSTLAQSGSYLEEATASLIVSSLSSLTVAQQLRATAEASTATAAAAAAGASRRHLLQWGASSVEETPPPIPVLMMPPPLTPDKPYGSGASGALSASDLHAQAVVSVCESVSGSLLQQLSVPGENAVSVTSPLVKVSWERMVVAHPLSLRKTTCRPLAIASMVDRRGPALTTAPACPSSLF